MGGLTAQQRPGAEGWGELLSTGAILQHSWASCSTASAVTGQNSLLLLLALFFLLPANGGLGVYALRLRLSESVGGVCRVALTPWISGGR